MGPRGAVDARLAELDAFFVGLGDLVAGLETPEE